MRISSENGSEERAAGREDNFMSADLLVLTGKGHVKEGPLLFVLDEAPLQHKILNFGFFKLKLMLMYFDDP